ncbi:MAG: PilZ domain-containing protein [Pirellulaceae bacterium]|jgi:hypothetical protein|nr:PilZ domain-containing protein [Pirellulaceae bacterium]MDP7014390.1 PilZ domain-containing protein [Pirellulaceae bacterium]
MNLELSGADAEKLTDLAQHIHHYNERRRSGRVDLKQPCRMRWLNGQREAVSEWIVGMVRDVSVEGVGVVVALDDFPQTVPAFIDLEIEGSDAINGVLRVVRLERQGDVGELGAIFYDMPQRNDDDSGQA